jgi:phosphoglycolate phosphatase
MSPAFPPRLIVFDLDGTLIDSRVDLCNSVNATLAHLGKPTLPEAVISGYIGDGASMLVRRAVGDPEGDANDEQYVTKALTFFLNYYRIHKLDYTYVYPGVLESLTAIRDRHPALPMAVLTNKPVNPSRAICAHFGLHRFFFANYGGNSFATKKPDPHGILTLIAEASALTKSTISPAETVMIGDSHVDVETARGCGARSLGCTFGLSPESLAAARPDASVDHASEWPKALGL